MGLTLVEIKTWGPPLGITTRARAGITTHVGIIVHGTQLYKFLYMAHLLGVRTLGPPFVMAHGAHLLELW